MVKSKCKLCGKEKEYKYPSTVKDYCSQKCSNTANWENKEKGKRVTLVCETCKDKFELLESVKRAREKKGEKIKYCSEKCMGLAMRTGEIKKCLNCESEFYTTRTKYCSAKCGAEYRKKTGAHKRKGYWYENGYKVLYTEDGKGIKEHIKIVQDLLGRKLREDEHVHHINGIKDDNRVENLHLMSKGDHSRLHRKKEKEEGKHLFGGYNNN